MCTQKMCSVSLKLCYVKILHNATIMLKSGSVYTVSDVVAMKSNVKKIFFGITWVKDMEIWFWLNELKLCFQQLASAWSTGCLSLIKL